MRTRVVLVVRSSDVRPEGGLPGHSIGPSILKATLASRSFSPAARAVSQQGDTLESGVPEATSPAIRQRRAAVQTHVPPTLERDVATSEQDESPGGSRSTPSQVLL